MFTVYHILGEYGKYQSLQLDDIKAVKNIHFAGTSEKKAWTKPRAFSLYPTLEEPDLWQCDFGSGIFAVRPSIARLLSNFVDRSCEMLPLPVEDFDEELLVCHTTLVVNCLNKKESVIDQETNRIEKYVFRPERLDLPLFKTPEARYSQTFCWEDSEWGPEDGFKGFVETHGLKGLTFKKIWSGKPE